MDLSINLDQLMRIHRLFNSSIYCHTQLSIIARHTADIVIVKKAIPFHRLLYQKKVIFLVTEIIKNLENEILGIVIFRRYKKSWVE